MAIKIQKGLSKHIREFDMKLFCYKAKCGDAFHLQYMGESGKERNVFLDMGHAKTYSSILKGVITNLLGSSEKIDALFLSHIHDDHIGGASRFIKDIQKDNALGNAVGQWIYNAPRKYDVDKTNDKKDGVLCGIVSGDNVYEHILAYSPSDLCDVIEGMSFNFDGMEITILSPDVNTLTRLRNKYSNNRPLCKSEIDEVSVEAGNVVDDYSIPLKELPVNNYQEDTSVENASSIAAILEFDSKRILWLSDSVSSVIVNSLSRLGVSEENKLYCDAVLLSHHGSAANNSLDLFKMIQADRYIISADGINRHCLPNKETVSRLVFASSKLPVTLCFNYDDGRIARMFDSDSLEDIKTMIDIHYLKDMDAIEIL